MSENYTIKDVTRDLAFLMTLTKIFEVDEEGYWFDPVDKKRFVYQLDSSETGREIALFQDPLPKGDVYFFNPFAEHFGKKSPAVTLYYKTIRLALNLDVKGVMNHVLQSLLEVKAANKAGEEHSLSHMLVRMSSVPIDRKSTLYDIVDEKMIEEFEKIFDRGSDELIHVPYLHQQMSAKITIDALTDPQWDDKFGKEVRKKSLAAFKAVLQGVLGIEKPEDMKNFTVKYDPDLKAAAKFYTTMSVYLRLYSKFNDVLSEKDVVDLGELAATIDRMPLAHAIAKHMVQATLPKVNPTDVATADTSTLRIGGSAGSHSGTRRFAGPPIIDDFGRQTRAGVTPTLQIARPTEPLRRFTPHVVSDSPLDPFSPSTRPVNTGFNAGVQSVGGYFGNSPTSGFNMQPAGLNLNPPSNFGAPGMRRTGYF